MEMKALLVVFVALLAYTAAQNIGQVVSFANANWNCADPQCTQRVPQGSFQDNYECAEFVARSLAAGGYIPNLGPLDAQSAYGSYNYNGQTYDLLWVSSKQGGSKGLEDFLIAAGWGTTSTSNIQAGYVLCVTGSDGPYSHTGIGVGNGIIDAHNAAEYQVHSIGTVNAIHTPPGSVASTASSGSGTTGGSSGSGSTSPSSGSGSTSPSSGSGPASSGSGSTSPSSGSGSTSPSSGSGSTSPSSGSGPASSGSGSTSPASGHGSHGTHGGTHGSHASHASHGTTQSSTSGGPSSTSSSYGVYFDSKKALYHGGNKINSNPIATKFVKGKPAGSSLKRSSDETLNKFDF